MEKILLKKINGKKSFLKQKEDSDATIVIGITKKKLSKMIKIKIKMQDGLQEMVHLNF